MLLYETVGQRQIVAHACSRSVKAGIRPGMALSVARAAIRGQTLVAEPHDARRTRRTIRRMAQWCHRFSPTVGLEDDAGICLDITGCAHLFAGERGMADTIHSAFHRRGFTTRIAIAPTYAAARALTRHGEHSPAVVERDALAEMLRPLSAAALGLEADTLDGLAEVNVKRLGELLRLPRAAVASRFGPSVLATLDRLLGHTPETITPIRPIEPPGAEERFDGPCASLEALSIASRTLLARFCDRLASRSLGARSWRLTLRRSDMLPYHVLIRHSVPTRDPKRMWALLEPRLERANLGFGVEGIGIVALATARIRPEQRAWGGDREEASPDNEATALVDTLCNRLGDGAVLRATLRQSHMPERAFVMCSALDPVPGTDEDACDGDRPTRLLDHPAEARVIALSPDGPVRQLTWRGGAHTLTACIGPERIMGEWWDGQHALRDYFKVQDEAGRWLWLFRDHLHARWFVHGEWA